MIDSDITALTASADKVIKVGGPVPYLVNLELQSSRQSDLVPTLWFRQAALFRRDGLPVLTVLILLRREADSVSISGNFEILMPDGWWTNRYNYRVVRLWPEAPEPYLAAGANLVPLVPLTDVPETELPDMVQKMAARINAQPPPRPAKLWTATYLLMGLSYSEELVSRLLEGVANMQESTTYQAILKEGRKEGLNEGRITGEQKILILLGTKKFSKPDATTLAAIEAIRDVERLESLSERIIDPDVRDWTSLLARPDRFAHTFTGSK